MDLKCLARGITCEKNNREYTMSKIHSFRHTLKNGQVITLTVDFGHSIPKMECTPKIYELDPSVHAEVCQWADTVIFSTVLDALDSEQMAALGKMGAKLLS